MFTPGRHRKCKTSLNVQIAWKRKRERDESILSALGVKPRSSFSKTLPSNGVSFVVTSHDIKMHHVPTDAAARVGGGWGAGLILQRKEVYSSSCRVTGQAGSPALCQSPPSWSETAERGPVAAVTHCTHQWGVNNSRASEELVLQRLSQGRAPPCLLFLCRYEPQLHSFRGPRHRRGFKMNI